MTSPERRRAPGMTPDQRRETIVQAALPLVAELGAGVTTAKIARAAGIGEATIFRVFEDKEAVLAACTVAAMDPTRVLEELRSIPLDQPLKQRLVDAVDALDAHLGRMGAVIGALRSTGARPAPTSPAARQMSTGRESSQQATREAVRELFEPDQDNLRLPTDTVTNTFLGLFYGRGRMPTPVDAEVTNDDLVDLFLHGALSR
ncbi:TetR/AcrR family transcriptional regulator [Actinoplanes sp. LDG1-06]|uniref:TetR/AcrR family transcriptional regulator n=1 Tax=Paractinoplanes ovalisporus TaxID=2810368 RepID=A0ABS2A8G5_9ACTN|nr:TetR/AcrR family transcriptional regulator [Actinoplanes ovalisporus]MBM2616040.1 TetR/AcrR family transcriptional regulator [Actinoplanes ovalisporus]